jgi:hypothetical protein
VQIQSFASPVSANSKRDKIDPSLKTKISSERNRKPKSSALGMARSSPYLRITDTVGSKAKNGLPGRSGSSTTQRILSCAQRITPPKLQRTLASTAVNNACTLVDSVLSLCNKSIASCSEIGAPVPSEGMFLLMVRCCGLTEAQHWAKMMELPHEKSAALLGELKNAL